MAFQARPALLLAILGLAAPLGCSDDTPKTVNVGPTGDPSLAIDSPSNGACIDVGSAPDAAIPIHVTPAELYLRPPGTCGAYKQCGHMVLRVNGRENNRGSGRIIEVKLQGEPISAIPTVELNITIEVLNDAEEPILNRAGEPVVASITITKVEPPVTCTTGAGGSGGAGVGGAGVGGSGGAGVGGSGGA